ncbi:MOSC domain-containing protein [Cypionkella sp. TWP1-2-1b2]|uniref:MOSC domain-containing protein n=1 Tax=Cypionkella sp. TWP1-2-1b2 TaxID=2804675 RepID=UPI003CE9DE37
MPALIPTEFYGTITWIGRVADRDAALESAPINEIFAGFDGPEGEAHGGINRPACSRVAALYKRNHLIRNTRQFAVMAAEDLAQIAAKMGLETLDPALLGTSLVIAGIPDFSRLPPSSRLQATGGATLVVDMENRPCTLPARPIENTHPGYGKAFKPAAQGLRGITAWVEAEGTLRLGAKMRLFIPDQPIWAQLGGARDGKTLI